MNRPSGYLPYFLLFTSLLSLIHSTLNYLAPLFSLNPFRGPAAPPPTPLLAHLYFGMNILVAAIRAQAGLDVTNRALYDLALGTFVLVLWVLGSEMLIWGTVMLADVGGPLVVTAVGAVWMVKARGAYVEGRGEGFVGVGK